MGRSVLSHSWSGCCKVPRGKREWLRVTLKVAPQWLLGLTNREGSLEQHNCFLSLLNMMSLVTEICKNHNVYRYSRLSQVYLSAKG